MVHDTDDKTWRHLDFFEHQAYLTAQVPRGPVRRAWGASGERAVGAAW